ncbi:MASE3 domain-containing protein [Dictyoglomus sp.]|uniref:sensor histidine kinase n=1 Tax=Dictyoglomus sp. TaxID=28205 RepID=UPI0024142CE0|nr:MULTISPECIES: MASE3 domain-containing protein [Dictyoglomus]
MTHLLLEFLSIFMSFIIFIVLISLPMPERTPFLQVIGTVFLSSAILDIPHTIYYAGFTGISNTGLSVIFWMFARFIQSCGLILAILHLKYKNLNTRFTSFTFLFPLLSILLIFLIKLLPTNIFHVEGLGTTTLKSVLEILYTLLFLTFSIKNKNNPYLLLSGVMFALSEIAFIKYASLFDWTLWFGHIFKILGVFNIAFYTLTNFIYNPLKDYKTLSDKYRREGEKLNETISKIISVQNNALETLSEAINYKDRKSLVEILRTFSEKENIEISVFSREKNIYSSSLHLPNAIEGYDAKKYCKIEGNETVIFIEKKDEIITKIYRLFILSIFSIFEKINYIDKLENLEKERKEFIKTVSHEFRNPLTIIFGQSQVLKSRFYSSPEKIKEIAEQIEISSKRISDLVDRLLKVGEEDGKDTGS